MSHFLRIKTYNFFYRLKRSVSDKYYRVRNIMRLDSTGVEYCDDIVTSGKLIISNLGSITIGKGVVINSGSWPNPVGCSDTRIYTQLPDSRIEIADKVGISSALIFAKKEITIGEGANIGSETMIIDNDFHSIVVDTQKGRRGEGLSEPVHIGKNVFIGARCIILKGVTIGDNSVVGAGSVVSKNIPENEVWAGNPAKFIKRIDNN